MTRTFARSPVWTWICDDCGQESGDLATDQHGLPTPDEMRARGWYVAKVFGDLCPGCVAEKAKR